MDRSPRIPANVQELTARRSVSATFVSRVQLAICRNEWALREARGVLHATAFSFFHRADQQLWETLGTQLFVDSHPMTIAIQSTKLDCEWQIKEGCPQIGTKVDRLRPFESKLKNRLTTLQDGSVSEVTT